MDQFVTCDNEKCGQNAEWWSGSLLAYCSVCYGDIRKLKIATPFPG